MGREVDHWAELCAKDKLWSQVTTDIFCLLDGNRLCRRLDGEMRSVGSGFFVPIEIVETGWRQFANLRHLTILSEMEVIAWAAK